MKSTQKGLLKNVQDGISRPLGSREIQKTKVETVFWDTLYFGNILVKILLNYIKMDIFTIYMERAFEKCPRWNF